MKEIRDEAKALQNLTVNTSSLIPTNNGNMFNIYFGAGMESLVTDQQVVFKPGPKRYESGSNNLLGAIALSCALLTMKKASFSFPLKSLQPLVVAFHYF